jgi:hypothetical protein
MDLPIEESKYPLLGQTLVIFFIAMQLHAFPAQRYGLPGSGAARD